MTTQRPRGGRMPEDRGDEPGFSDAVWRRFVEDSERAIRRSAPREPSARERAAGGGLSPEEAVGELWSPDEPGPAWRDMDPRARRRRVGGVLGALVLIAVIVAVARPGGPSGARVDHSTTSSQSGEATDRAPGLPLRTQSAQPSKPSRVSK